MALTESTETAPRSPTGSGSWRRPMTTAAQRISHRLGSLRLGQKLTLIYMAGIFVPLLVANGLILRNVLHEAAAQETAFLDAAVEGMRDSIVREFEPIEQVSDFVYADSVIYRLLSSSFPRFQDYVEAHGDYLLPALNKYVSVFPGISRMIVYTENPIVGVSQGYLRSNEYVRDTDWYQMMERSTSGIFTIVHDDFDRRSEIEEKTYISMFRKLDNPLYRRVSRLTLRIDVNPTVLVRHVQPFHFLGWVELVGPTGNVAVSAAPRPEVEDPYAFDIPIESLNSLAGWHIRGELVRGAGPESSGAGWIRLITASGASILVSSLLILLLSRSFTTRLASLSAQMRKVEREDFSHIAIAHAGHDEINQLLVDYNIMASKIEDLINNRYKLELERSRLRMEQHRAELNALQSQVNPHFLYNVLESIRMKSQIRGEVETAGVIKKLSKAFRRITSWETDMVPLAEEVAFTREYLDIQQYRFGDRLKAEIRFNPCVQDFLVPKLTIQALVENACVHGLEPRPGGGEVRVAVDMEDGTVVIRISDDGVGCDADQVNRSLGETYHDSRHIGIANIWRRLGLRFGDGFDFRFESEAGRGTSVTITIRSEDGSTETSHGRR